MGRGARVQTFTQRGNLPEQCTTGSAVPQHLVIGAASVQQVALILRLMTSWNFTEEELALLRSMPKHEAEPYEPLAGKAAVPPSACPAEVGVQGGMDTGIRGC